MTKLAFASIFALLASTALAQTGAAPGPAAEPATPAAPQNAAPETPAAPAGTDPAADQQAGSVGPTNLCQELLAFMQAPPPEGEAPAAAPAKPAAASTEQAAPAAQQGASALAGTTDADAAASAEPDGEANSAQEVSGQDGVATDSPEPSNEKVAAGSVANAPQKESRAAPLPPADVTSTPKESVLTVAEAEKLASANDVAACQDTAREMRVAGVAMPPPLIALAALDLQYQQTAAPQSQAPDGDAPASGQEDAGPETQAPAPANAAD